MFNSTRREPLVYPHALPSSDRRSLREVFALSDSHQPSTSRPVGVRDIPLVLLTPRRVFSRIEDVPSWSWPLVILLTCVTLIGYATVETGLIDREVERGVQARIAEIDSQQRDVVERSALRELYDQERKTGEFLRMLTRIRVMVAEPAKALAATLLTAAMLYAMVALTGCKPQWHTLLTICVLAGFIDLLRLTTELALVLNYHTLAVDTSLSMVPGFWVAPDGSNLQAMAALSGLASVLDPFRIWYWLVVIAGLNATAQLRGWRAWAACMLGWLGGAAARGAVTAALIASNALKPT